jgi:hypothetical protein
MKTPREILLARHQSAMPKLDAIRQDMVGELNNHCTKEQSFGLVARWLGGLKNIWLELIFPSRRIWAGLAAVWILIVAANFSMRDHSQLQMAQASPSPQMMMAFRQQEELLTELIGPNDSPVAEPARPSLPRPTSLRRVEILTA